MTKRYDQVCKACGHIYEIRCEPFANPSCPRCSGPTERIYLPGTYSVVGDEIPGGKWVENLGHEPVFVESKSQLKFEAEKRGLVNKVRHIGSPGSDKSPHTTRWV